MSDRLPSSQSGRTAYVAGRFSDWRLIRDVQDVLRAEGYWITYDWTIHAEPKEAQAAEWKGEIDPQAQRTAALTDLEAAHDAGLLVLVCNGDMAGALGCFVEFGAAAVAGRRIDVIAPARNSIFWHLPNVTVYASVDEWIGRPEEAAA